MFYLLRRSQSRKQCEKENVTKTFYCMLFWKKPNKSVYVNEYSFCHTSCRQSKTQNNRATPKKKEKNRNHNGMSPSSQRIIISKCFFFSFRFWWLNLFDHNNKKQERNNNNNRKKQMKIKLFSVMSRERERKK